MPCIHDKIALRHKERALAKREEVSHESEHARPLFPTSLSTALSDAVPLSHLGMSIQQHH